MKINRKKEDKQRKFDDCITNKILLVFALCFVGVFGLMLLLRMLDYGNSFSFAYNSIKVLSGVGFVIAIFGIVRMFHDFKYKVKQEYTVIKGGLIFSVGAILSVTMFAILNINYQLVIKGMYIILPAIAILYLIYYTYPLEFFAISSTSVLALFVMYVVYKGDVVSIAHLDIIVVLLFLLFIVALAVITRKVYSLGGRIKIGEREFVIYKDTDNLTRAYKLCNINYSIISILVIVSYILTPIITFYLMILLVVYLFMSAAYFTVKLM